MAGVQPIYSGLTPGLVLTSDPLTEQVNILAGNLQNLSDYAYAYTANGSQQTASNNINTLSSRITVNSNAIANLGTSTQASIAQLAANVASSFTVSNAAQVAIRGNVSALQTDLTSLSSQTANSFAASNAVQLTLGAGQQTHQNAILTLQANLAVAQGNLTSLAQTQTTLGNSIASLSNSTSATFVASNLAQATLSASLASNVTSLGNSIASLSNSTSTTFNVSNSVQTTIAQNVSILQSNVGVIQGNVSQLVSNSAQQAQMINLLWRQTQWLYSNKSNNATLLTTLPAYPTA